MTPPPVARLLLMLGLGGCVELDPSAMDVCVVGEPGCVCTRGGGCDPGLECRNEVCGLVVGPASGGPIDESTGGGSGDDSTSDGDSSSSGGSSGPDPAEVAEVCDRWLSDRADMTEGVWTGGDAATCTAGDITPEGRTNALRIVNLYRWMAGQPAVTLDDSRSAQAQECALLLHANDQTAEPTTDWACYTREINFIWDQSSKAGRPAVSAVDLYLTSLNRMWMLANQLGPIGVGSTDGWSCMWVVGGTGASGRPWTAWPPPGPFPSAAIAPGGVSPLHQFGWSLQSATTDLSLANVVVTTNGQTLPVTVTVSEPNQGTLSSIRFDPSGWSSQPGTSYHVRVDGIVGNPIEYDVHIVDCG